MADYDSSLPIRSEADGADERVQTKIVDKSNPDTQQMTVDTDSNAHVEVHGNRVDDAADIELALSEEGKANGRGDYEVDDNSEPNSVGLIAHERNASKTQAHQLKRVSAIDSTEDTDVTALDVAMRDEQGNPFTSNNPLPVAISESEGSEIIDYNTSSSVAADASVNHDYVVTALMKFVGTEMSCSGSGKIKAELKIETGVGAGTYNTIETKFNSTANPNIEFNLAKIVAVAAGVNIRVTLTNRDNQPQDVYSTLKGIETAA